MRPSLGLVLSSLSLTAVKAAKLPAKIYGVNLGSWLVLEPWMLPNGWRSMGGQSCSDCSACIASEYAFVKAYGQATSDQRFNQHWTSWFTQADVNRLKSLGINTVRIPLGYWLVEDLVNRSTEFYPKGGLAQLKRGLQQLNAAGIVAILDHHALPGVQDSQQQFTGRCTTDVQFYKYSNYHRALIWTAVMTTISHVDAAFGNVVAIEAVNEQIMDASKTPGYGDFSKNFVQVIRAVETLLGVHAARESSKRVKNLNVTSAFENRAGCPSSNAEVCSVLRAAVPILQKLGYTLPLTQLWDFTPLATQTPLNSVFMDINWQYNNPSNPADAAKGPQYYDNHLYYSFGGVADANENAYMTHICNLDRVQKDAAQRNSPLFFGEWALPTQFSASDAFLRKWADAQKLAYSQGAGWVFWNFKTESDSARQWSYFEGVNRGYLTQDPSKYNDPHVCDAYRRILSTNSTESA